MSQAFPRKIRRLIWTSAALFENTFEPPTAHLRKTSEEFSHSIHCLPSLTQRSRFLTYYIQLYIVMKCLLCFRWVADNKLTETQWLPLVRNIRWTTIQRGKTMFDIVESQETNRRWTEKGETGFCNNLLGRQNTRRLSLIWKRPINQF